MSELLKMSVAPNEVSNWNDWGASSMSERSGDSAVEADDCEPVLK